MMKPAIQSPLTKAELKELIHFLSHHLGYVPLRVPKVVFCSTAKEFAALYESYKVRDPERVDEINKEANAFYDPTTETIVFQGFSYHEGVEIPKFIIPMSTVVHELIHFFQNATGTYGSYRILYEGTNDLLSCFLMNDFAVDYRDEAAFAFNLIMEISGQDFWKTFEWMKRFTLHSNKNRFVHHEIKACPSFSKYNPRKLLMALDNNNLAAIENEDTRNILTRYSLRKIIQMCQKNRAIIQL
jgi:hypothetical protein